MKKHISILLTAMLICLMAFPSASFAQTATATASDYNAHWAKTEIETAINAGILTGYPDGSVKPNKEITRAEFFVMINKAFVFESKKDIQFTDCKSSDWYYPVIQTAMGAGYVAGYEDNTIKPNKSITREEAAVIVAKIKSLSTAETSNRFADASKTAKWSTPYIIAVNKAGIMKGYADGSFKPTNKITRAEAVVTILKASGKTSTNKATSGAITTTAVAITSTAVTSGVGGSSGVTGSSGSTGNSGTSNLPDQTISGMISLPSGDTALSGGLPVKVLVQQYGESGSYQASKTLAAGTTQAAYSFTVAAGSYTVSYQNDQSVNYETNGYYTNPKTSVCSSCVAILNATSSSYNNVNLLLLPKGDAGSYSGPYASISGAVKLPDSAVASSGGLDVVIEVADPTATVTYHIHAAIAAGQNSATYGLTGLPAGSYMVYYYKVTGGSFAAPGYYNSGGNTKLDSSYATVLTLGTAAVSGIDLTLVE